MHQRWARVRFYALGLGLNIFTMWGWWGPKSPLYPSPQCTVNDINRECVLERMH